MGYIPDFVSLRSAIKHKVAICILCILCAGADIVPRPQYPGKSGVSFDTIDGNPPVCYMVITLVPLSTEMDTAFDVQKHPSKLESFFENLSEIGMKTRSELVKKRCREIEQRKSLEEFTRKDLPARSLISDRYQVVGCKAAKIASTNLQRIFYVLNGFTNTTDTGNVNKGAARKKTNAYFGKRRKNKIEEIKSRLKAYTNFMFVRHPLERILSAYRDEKPSGMFKEQKKTGIRLEFRAYVDKVLNKKSHLTRPLRPLYQLCKPCQVQYKFVGSLDVFDDDITTILNDIGAEKAVTIPKRNETGYNQKKSSSVVGEFYKDIPVEKIAKLEDMYKTDYFIFNFERYAKP